MRIGKRLGNKKKGQVATEIVIIGSIMVFLLLSIFIANNHLSEQTDLLKKKANSANSVIQAARAINIVATSKDKSTIVFFNKVEPGVANMSVYEGRVVRAYYRGGTYYSAPIVTDNTQVAEKGIPINDYVIVKNIDGKIYVGGFDDVP